MEEAIRITHMSKASLQDSNQSDRPQGGDQKSRIFTVLRDAAIANDGTWADFQTVEVNALFLVSRVPFFSFSVLKRKTGKCLNRTLV